jgi:predicted ABC-type ATPase
VRKQIETEPEPHATNGKYTYAVWACGPASSGKSTIAAAAVQPLGFELADLDATFEELLTKYELTNTIPDISPKEKERLHAEHIARQTAEALLAEDDADGIIDPKIFLVRLSKALHENNLTLKFVLELEKIIREKVGMKLQEGDVFLKEICPEMGDWETPEEFLFDRPVINPFHILLVAREIIRRKISDALEHKKNILIIDRGAILIKVLETKKQLEGNGFHSYLLWFGLDNIQLAVERNLQRAEAGGRKDTPKIISRSFQMTSLARDLLISQFNPNTASIDNTPTGDQHIEAHIEKAATLIKDWMAGCK